MKAPITGNSITERVQFTGMYVPDPTWHTEAEEDAPAAPDGAEREPLEAA
jgi:hypothetical protein